MIKFWIVTLFALLFCGSAHAQGNQCRTATVGASTPNCASEAFVTESIGAIPPPPGGTVTEQKNTFGYGLTGSGNCDNTSTNAASPCNAVVALIPSTIYLTSDVALNNSTFTAGPSIGSLGGAGKFLAIATLQLSDAATDLFTCQLVSGATVGNSKEIVSLSTQTVAEMVLVAVFTSPTTITAQCKASNATGAAIKANLTAAGNKDSSLDLVRLQ